MCPKLAANAANTSPNDNAVARKPPFEQAPHRPTRINNAVPI
jgi:hypothetical protein